MKHTRYLLFLTLAACSAPAAEMVDAQTPVLVSTDWVAEHADDPAVLLVKVALGNDEDGQEFIPGSRFLDYHEIALMEVGNLRVELAPVEELVETLRTLGMTNEHHVVFYGSPGHMPARAYMTMDYLGHGDRTSVLDGGLEAWKAEGRALAAEAASGARSSFTAHLQDDVLVDADWISARLDDPTLTLIDARPEDEYTGERTPRDLRPGHIPGAYNLFWRDLLVSEDEPVLQSVDRVRARFEEAGLSDDGVVVSYCYIGMRASYTYLISKHLGLEARFYDGSWNDWGSRDDTPAVEGRVRR